MLTKQAIIYECVHTFNDNMPRYDASKDSGKKGANPYPKSAIRNNILVCLNGNEANIVISSNAPIGAKNSYGESDWQASSLDKFIQKLINHGGKRQ